MKIKNFKLLALVLIMAINSNYSKAQLGIGTTTPNSSSVLDISSTNKGLLLPRMTNAQKNAISNPAVGLIVFCTDCGTAGLMNIFNGTSWVRLDGNISNTPSISTTSISSITATSATSGGNLISIGGSNVSARGVCWSTTPNPTTANSVIDNGATSSAGSFTCNLSGLTSNTTYYLRAYAANSSGTAYGDQISFNTPIAIGSVYGGGIVAYLLVSGDAGYDANVQHGLILSSSNLLNTNSTWGCATSVSTSSAIGSGATNTAAIIATNCATANTAAKLCNDYSVTVNGTTYDDWYLPSYSELYSIWSNRGASGVTNMGDATTPTFATSTQNISNSIYYWALYFFSTWNGQWYNATKTTLETYTGVRAVRSF